MSDKELQEIKARYTEGNTKYRDVGKCTILDFQLLFREIERLKAERDKAVEDMNAMALAMRESDELAEGCCFACICENLPDNCILPYGECPGYEKTDCFEWRGLEGTDNV